MISADGENRGESTTYPNAQEHIPDEWVPLTYAGMPDEIKLHYNSKFPIGDEIRTWAIEQFEAQSGLQFSPASWTESDKTTFRKWWWFQLENGDFIFRTRRSLEPVLHMSMTTKASMLAQRHCHICSGMLPSDALFPISMMPIRIAPQSRQTMKKIKWSAFQAAISDWFGCRKLDIGPSKHLCVAITYVLSSKRKNRDLDNMTKALMDAFSRAIGFDDKDISHLDVLKLIEKTPEEYVFIRLSPSYLHDKSTVMTPFFDGKWGVGEALKLEDYMD